MLICPVCSAEITKTENIYKCCNNHSFDRAKEGYVNLLSGRHKAGELIGDNRDMAKARRLFLEKGHYDFLADKLCSFIKPTDNVLDISCGEGYYTDFFRRKTAACVSGFDISKEMIKLAAKKYKETFFFVANITKIPVADESIDTAIQICAPFSEKEFARILKKDGKLLSVVPAKKHLWEMKQVLYSTPYENDEDNTVYEKLILADEVTVSSTINLSSSEEIMSLFAMTPYYYRTSDEDKANLSSLSELITQAEFRIRVFKKT